MYVEQAVFTSGKTRHGQGYHVVARSPGISSDMLIAMNRWCPSHASLSLTSLQAESLNFHPLPSGAYCVSRSLTVGGAYRDGGRCVYTHCLIVPPETLARFGNNPFSLIRATSNQGLWRVDDPADPLLNPLWLPGGAAPVDEALLTLLATDPGPENMAALVQAARDAVCLAVGGAPSPVAERTRTAAVSP